MAPTTDRLTTDWRDLVYRGVESDELDYKSAMNWNRMPRAGRAKIVRHCLALANTKGGYIVIGVGEDASGHPSVYTGLTPEETHSFDPSIVGPFLNRHVEPPLDFTIERPVIDGKRYAIFVVRPFAALPHVCANGVEGELQQGVFYIRTTDASSRPAVRALEMHALIQRALRNQRELLGRMLRGILYENRGVEDDSAGRFTDDLDSVRRYFLHRHPAASGVLRLELSAAPPEYDPERFTFAELRHAAQTAWTLLQENAFLNDEPRRSAYCTNTALRVVPERGDRFFQLSRSGLLYYTRLLPIPERKLEYAAIVKFCAEAVHFLGRLYPELGFVEQLLTIRVDLAGAEGVELAAGRPAGKSAATTPAVCRIADVRTTLRRSVADLASADEVHAARLVREIGERFNLPENRYRQLPKLIRGYLEKR